MDISVVVPVYGCPSAIPELHNRLIDTLENMNVEFEIILVDDCDGMGSWEEIRKVAEFDKRVLAVRFTKNFGQGSALTAGIKEASGNWIITMDCDLQDSPEEIPTLYKKAKEGFDVVFVRRTKRKESFSIRWFSKMFHNVISYLSEVPFDYSIGTYLIASKRAARDFLDSKDRGRDFSMYLMWLGYKHDYIDLEQQCRYAGKTSYSFSKKIRWAFELITSYSTRLLYIPVYLGVIASIASVIYIVFVFFSFFILHENPEGWSTIVAAIFFFGGMILSTLGIIGMYIGNIFDVSKERPLFVVQEKINCDTR